MSFLQRTPVRTFIVYPMITIAWEFAIRGGTLEPNFWYLPLMLWGCLQYRLCGRYRIKHGGGGPGLETPPERLVSTGPYAYSRNPMYLGHVIFLTGLTLTFKSWLAGLIAIALAAWFYTRVLGDETKLIARLASPTSNIWQV